MKIDFKTEILIWFVHSRFYLTQMKSMHEWMHLYYCDVSLISLLLTVCSLFLLLKHRLASLLSANCHASAIFTTYCYVFPTKVHVFLQWYSLFQDSLISFYFKTCSAINNSSILLFSFGGCFIVDYKIKLMFDV